MKKLIKNAKPSFFLLTIFITLIFKSSNGQQISTVAEIYNYDIGDFFHVQELGTSNWGGFSKQFSYEITGKYYSSAIDTVFYTRYVKTALSSSDHPEWVFDEFFDTVFFTNLYSLINEGIIDSVYSDLERYNGRIINHNSYVGSYYYGTDIFIVGCGGPYFDYIDWEQNINHYLELKYFKKGDEEWGEQLMVSTGPLISINNNLLVYPNPFHSQFKIDLTYSDSKDCQGYILNVCGNQINNFLLKPNQINIIDLPNLPKGIYFLQISGKKVYNQMMLKQ